MYRIFLSLFFVFVYQKPTLLLFLLLSALFGYVFPYFVFLLFFRCFSFLCLSQCPWFRRINKNHHHFTKSTRYSVYYYLFSYCCCFCTSIYTSTEDHWLAFYAIIPIRYTHECVNDCVLALLYKMFQSLPQDPTASIQCERTSSFNVDFSQSTVILCFHEMWSRKWTKTMKTG